jgi:hypothetical protein
LKKEKSERVFSRNSIAKWREKGIVWGKESLLFPENPYLNVISIPGFAQNELFYFTSLS